MGAVNKNTLLEYADTVAGEMFPQKFWGALFQNRYRKQRELYTQNLYNKFEIVAKSYHDIGVQNFEALLGGKCCDVHGKQTKKIGVKEIKSAKPAFKP